MMTMSGAEPVGPVAEEESGPGDSPWSLPPRLRVFAPATAQPTAHIGPTEPASEAELPLSESLPGVAPSPRTSGHREENRVYRTEIPIEVLSGVKPGWTADEAEPVDTTPGKGFELPSRLSLVFVIVSALILISVPFLVALLWENPGHDVAAAPPETGAGDNGTASMLGGATPAGAEPFDEVAGPGCVNDGAKLYHETGRYSQGQAGWVTGNGGYAGSGCTGRFSGLPMTGDDARADSDVLSSWTFTTSMSMAQCRILVYVPHDLVPLKVGGSPAHYSVHLGADIHGPDLAGFHIDQPENLGQWVAASTVRVPGGRFTIRLTNAGRNTSSDPARPAHIASAQIRAMCAPVG